MNVISSRKVLALNDGQDIFDRIKHLRRKIHFSQENIDTAKNTLDNAENEDEYNRIKEHIRHLEDIHAEFVTELNNLETPYSSRGSHGSRKEEIDKYGFTLTNHAVQRYNMRFTPYYTRDQLMSVLAKMGLGSKVNHNRHLEIELRPNFIVAFERGGVISTFRYRPEYYQQPNPPKVNIGVV